MKVIEYTGSTALTQLAGGCVMVMGFFDGVHLAHRELIARGRRIADAENIPLCIFTFSAEEKKLKSSGARLYTQREKLCLLERCGADYVLVPPFSLLMDMTPEEFVVDFIVGKCHAEHLVSGYNFHFGKGGIGNADLLKRLAESVGCHAHIVEEYRLFGETLSSTYIKQLLDKGCIRDAAVALGLPYFISGRVSHGRGIGHTMGLPTVNISMEPRSYLLKNGVYATVTEIGGNLYPSLTNIGVCPTFGRREKHSETYIMDFSADLYDEEIRIYFLDFIRDEMVFQDEKQLIMQIEIDKNTALSYRNEELWEKLGLK